MYIKLLYKLRVTRYFYSDKISLFEKGINYVFLWPKYICFGYKLVYLIKKCRDRYPGK